MFPRVKTRFAKVNVVSMHHGIGQCVSECDGGMFRGRGGEH